MLTPQQQIPLRPALLQFVAKLIYSGLGGQYTSELMEEGTGMAGVGPRRLCEVIRSLT